MRGVLCGQVAGLESIHFQNWNSSLIPIPIPEWELELKLVELKMELELKTLELELKKFPLSRQQSEGLKMVTINISLPPWHKTKLLSLLNKIKWTISGL